MSPRRGSRRAAGAALLAATLLLGGCGGGVWVGVGPDDDPPGVALAVSPTQAVPGQTVALLADARDDYHVDYVAFYQLLPDGSAVRLGIQFTPPYQLNVVLPTDAAPLTQFFARAVDDVGQFADSAVATVQVLR
ncbi:hypothetical protein [Azohydromonas australica]|uniref:hypothetical protein n=1 Tax=Azohydromonas australica TaxID=364039 RepID=UPI000404362A|nr:hypothetical protein [Azohydromonas australica]